MTAMTPELTDELEVEFILWEAEDPLSRPCEALKRDCPNVALYRMLWVPSSEAQKKGFPACHCGTSRLCLSCKDWVINQEPNDWSFYYCERCKGFSDLKGIEPIRSSG